MEDQKHLRYDYIKANIEGENHHAQKVMRELGITYREAVPQSLGDQWWFYDCENIPENLPPYITELKIKP